MASEFVQPLFHWNRLSAAMGRAKRSADKALAISLHGSAPNGSESAELRTQLREAQAQLAAATADVETALRHLDQVERMAAGAA